MVKDIPATQTISKITHTSIRIIFRYSNKLFRSYPFCHSRPDRALSYKGQYFGLCARCTGMYLSGFVTLMTMIFWGRSLSPEVGILVGILLLVPGGIDGTTQLFGERESTNTIRVLTGLLLGIGVVLIAYNIVSVAFIALF